MWISKKKWKALEKRVADIEGQVQSQPDVKIDVEKLKEALRNIERLGLSVELPFRQS